MILRVTDFETCGLPPDNCQPVEAATVDLISDDPVASITKAEFKPSAPWTRGPMWRSFINPGRPIPPEASAIHHIVDDDVKGAPRIAEFPPFSEKADVLVAHEMKFERAVMQQHGHNIDLNAPWICTRKCSMLAWPDAPNHKNQCLRYWLELKLADPSLATPHRALGDAYVTAAILRRLVQQYSVQQLIEASANPVLLPRLTFGEHAMKPAQEVPMSYWSWIVEKSKGPWDEDVLYTAQHHLHRLREASRSRSPV